MSKILKYTDWKCEQALWLQKIIDPEIILGLNKHREPFDAVVIFKYQEYLMFFSETRFNEELQSQITSLSNNLFYHIAGASNPYFDPDLHKYIDELMDELTYDL